MSSGTPTEATSAAASFSARMYAARSVESAASTEPWNCSSAAQKSSTEPPALAPPGVAVGATDSRGRHQNESGGGHER